ncbi:MAG: hypothetical protein KDK26_04305 [Roseivivax sp.]|nr:hypothetical protein [Roseivivax sp.]
MAQTISASVGKGGKNKSDDVKTVQTLLNKFTRDGGFSKLKVDGVSGPKTEGAIGLFQSKVMKTRADKRVDRGKPTMTALNTDPKKLKEEEPKAPTDPTSGGAGAKPQVSGKTQGVDKKILNVLNEVSSHYGKKIEVTSGLRTPQKQGEVMWDYWTSNLKRGDLYIKIRNDKALKQRLNDAYDAGDKKTFVSIIKPDAASYSRHVRGLAVDIKKNTDPKMVAAIATVLRQVTEKLCIHFDNRDRSVPAAIPEKTKAKWK